MKVLQEKHKTNMTKNRRGQEKRDCNKKKQVILVKKLRKHIMTNEIIFIKADKRNAIALFGRFESSLILRRVCHYHKVCICIGDHQTNGKQ